MSDARAAARAIDAMRRGWPIAIAALGEAPVTMLAIETADAGRLAGFGGDYALLISSGRAETLKLTNQRVLVWQIRKLNGITTTLLTYAEMHSGGLKRGKETGKKRENND